MSTINSNIASNGQPQILMAGDSMMSIKAQSDYPETGWGMPFARLFTDDIKVINLAKNGCSTASFRTEGLWQKILDVCRPGDYVFIQFSHNDEIESKTTYTTAEQFKANLHTFIDEVRSKQAQVILLTSVTRRHFAADGQIGQTHPYSAIVEKVARQSGLVFIDMDSITREYFNQMGDAQSATRFMHIPPGMHPNYPSGVTDNTHLNEMGASEVAHLVLKELVKLHHPLCTKLRASGPTD